MTTPAPPDPPKRPDEWKWRLIGFSGAWIIDALFATSRIHCEIDPKSRKLMESRRFIAAVWHSRILLISYLHKGWNAAALVSASDDGEIIARILRRQGHETIRGSTTRGGIRALTTLVRRLREKDRPGVVIPDGPQGPRFRVQSGVITLAKKTGYPIVPITYSARRGKIFSSWDRFFLPYPVNHCVVVYGAPVPVPSTADRNTEESLRRLLESRLMEITRAADRRFGRRID